MDPVKPPSLYRDAPDADRTPDPGPALAEALRVAAATNSDRASELAPDLAALQARLTRQTGPVESLRCLSTRFRLCGLCGVATVLVLVNLVLLRRGDLAQYPLLRFAAELGAAGLLTTLTALAWLRPLHRAQLSALVRWVLVVSVLLAAIVPAALPVAHSADPQSLRGVGAELVPRAVACLVYGSIFAAIAMLAGLALGRHGFRVPLRMCLVGLFGAVTGLAGLHAHCPITQPSHLLLGHATVPWIFAWLGPVAAVLIARRPASP